MKYHFYSSIDFPSIDQPPLDLHMGSFDNTISIHQYCYTSVRETILDTTLYGFALLQLVIYVGSKIFIRDFGMFI
jgi:hypothetical protein